MKTFGAMPVKGFDYDPDIPGDYERAWTRLQAEADTAANDIEREAEAG